MRALLRLRDGQLGIHALVSLDAGKRKGARPGWDGGVCAFTRCVLATDAGEALTGEALPLAGEVAIRRLARRTWTVPRPREARGRNASAYVCGD